MLFPPPKDPIQRREFLLNLWRSAVAEPFGVRIPCDSPTSLRTQLYAVRKDFPDPAILSLSIIIDANHLYILPPSTP